MSDQPAEDVRYWCITHDEPWPCPLAQAGEPMANHRLTSLLRAIHNDGGGS